MKVELKSNDVVNLGYALVTFSHKVRELGCDMFFRMKPRKSLFLLLKMTTSVHLISKLF